MRCYRTVICNNKKSSRQWYILRNVVLCLNTNIKYLICHPWKCTKLWIPKLWIIHWCFKSWKRHPHSIYKRQERYEGNGSCLDVRIRWSEATNSGGSFPEKVPGFKTTVPGISPNCVTRPWINFTFASLASHTQRQLELC